MLAGPEEIRAAVARLRAGGLVAFPTETVYGLGADALREDAVARVFTTKGRPSNNPLIVHVSGPEMARRVVAGWSAEAQKLAEAFWPGPLSLVLPRARDVPSLVTAGGPNVAVRCPDHPTTLALLDAFGGPLVGPSANPSGRVSPTTAAHVRESFSEDQVFVLEGGACRGGIESTVVRLVGVPVVLRLGLISAEAIGRVLAYEVQAARPDAALESPGMLESHYAPQTRTVLCAAEQLGGVLAGAGKAAVVSHEAIDVRPPHVLFGLPADARGYAAGLYSALRLADAAGADLIVVVAPRVGGSPEDRAIWEAVLDRLRRATAGG